MREKRFENTATKMSSAILHHHNPFLRSSPQPHISNSPKPYIRPSKLVKSLHSSSISGLTTSVPSTTPNPKANPIATSDDLLSLLKGQKNSGKALDILQQATKQSADSLPPYAYELMIRRLGFGGRFRQMREVFRLMSPPTEEAFLGMINSYANHQMLDEALLVLKEMEVIDIPLTTKCYNVVFNLIVDMNKLNLLGPLYSQMTSAGVQPDVKTFNLLIKALRNDNKFDSALSLLKQMSSHHGLVPNDVTYKTLMNGLVKNYGIDGALENWKLWELNGHIPSNMIFALCQTGKVEEAIELLEEKCEGGFCPNSDTFNMIVNGFFERGKLDEAAMILEEMCATGFSPNIVTFNTITHYFCKSKEAEKAALLFERMVEKGFKPTVVTYTTLISGLCRTGQMGSALRLLKQMASDHDLTVSKETYSRLIRMFLKQDEVKGALEVLKEMNSNGWVLRNGYYNDLLRWYCKRGRMEMASRLLEGMSEIGLCPDTTTFDILINGFYRKGWVSEATRLLEEMSRSGFCPDIVTINTIINGFCRAREVGKAADVREKMAEEGFKPNGVTYNTLIAGLCHIGKYKEARRLLNEMIVRNFVPSVTTYNFLIHAELEQGGMDKAIDFLNELLGKGIRPNGYTHRTLLHSLCKGCSLDDSIKLIDKMLAKECIPISIAYELLKKRLFMEGTVNQEIQGSKEI